MLAPQFGELPAFGKKICDCNFAFRAHTAAVFLRQIIITVSFQFSFMRSDQRFLPLKRGACAARKRGLAQERRPEHFLDLRRETARARTRGQGHSAGRKSERKSPEFFAESECGFRSHACGLAREENGCPEKDKEYDERKYVEDIAGKRNERY